MEKNRVYITRHGARIDFEDPNWGLNAENPHDPTLSANGEQQALELGKILQDLDDVKITHIFCSPWSRTVQTAKPFAEQNSIPIFIENGIFETI